MDMNLIGKTELWIQDIHLNNANLNDISAAAASALGLEPSEVPVVDAGPNHVTLDVLRQTMDFTRIAGREAELFAALANVRGVSVTETTSVHSEGILQMLSLDPSLTEDVLTRTQSLTNQISQAFLRRVKVIPTGHEVLRGVIEDTNSPYLKCELERAGYRVSIAPPQPDNMHTIANVMEAAFYEAYGMIVTTGGVGAEAKDQTIEATQRLDPSAATAWVVKYPPTGRHVKPGVRIAVGSVGEALIVNLPGPNDEVKACLPVLLAALGTGERDKTRLAGLLADVLRQRHLQ